jgi:plastocyanin
MRTAILAASAVLATAFSGAAAAPALAGPGCGVTVHVHNQLKSAAITVQWSKSDSRIHTIAGPGFWKKLGSGTTKVKAGKTGSKAFTLDFSCSTKHQYRIHYTHGNSSAYAHFPKDTSDWTTQTSFTVQAK